MPSMVDPIPMLAPPPIPKSSMHFCAAWLDSEIFSSEVLILSVSRFIPACRADSKSAHDWSANSARATPVTTAKLTALAKIK